MKMHGPVTISAKVMFTDEENVIEAVYDFPMATYPTDDDIEEAIAGVVKQVTSQVGDGFRLFTKREMFDHMVTEKTGLNTSFSMGGHPTEWDIPS